MCPRSYVLVWSPSSHQGGYHAALLSPVLKWGQEDQFAPPLLNV
jgi:hypothetical protein